MYLFLIVGAAVVLLAVSGVVLVRSRLKRFSREVFGTDSIAEGLKKIDDTVAETPKSVSSMTRLMEPQIVRDFPDFVWEEFRHKAENMLTSAFLAISANDIRRLQGASADVQAQVRNCIAENEAAGIQETYTQIRIHQTEIAGYHKKDGKCTITIQSAVEYYHCKIQDGHVTEGSKERKEQAKYNMELLYIQDSDKADGNALGTVCPCCGAPVRTLGHMVCEYCGSAVTPVNTKIWELHKYYEVDYRHA